MSEHLTESTIGGEVTAYCPKCKRPTAHRVDRVAVNSHAGKPGPCLEHHSQWMTQDQIARREYLLEQTRQGKLFGDPR
jgi:ribosomal protein L44E